MYVFVYIYSPIFFNTAQLAHNICCSFLYLLITAHQASTSIYVLSETRKVKRTQFYTCYWYEVTNKQKKVNAQVFCTSNTNFMNFIILKVAFTAHRNLSIY